jgi:hypothetical protein
MKIERHGSSKTRTYRIWTAMLARCRNPNVVNYRNYGGKGIKVCPEWEKSFSQFLTDMGPVPEKMSIGRKDSSLDYCKDNCKWETDDEQHANISTNRKVTFKGETLCIFEWARRTGLSAKSLYARLYAGWTDDEIVSIPKRGKRTQK